MNSLLAKSVEVHQKDWPQRLAYVVAAYNATVHESTGYSPNFRNPPVDRLSVNDYADHLVTSLQEAYCDARSLWAGFPSGSENIPARLRSCVKSMQLITRSERGHDGQSDLSTSTS